MIFAYKIDRVVIEKERFISKGAQIFLWKFHNEILESIKTTEISL